MRCPGSADALRYALHACAHVLAEGAAIWVFGRVEEGVLVTKASLVPIFRPVGKMLGNSDSRILMAVRTSATPRAPISAWLEESTVDVGAGEQPWCVLPGLFAGGSMDVMTALLLDRLALVLPPHSRVLDFGCGSGTLAAALRCRCEAQVTLLDADAVAIEVARKNIPGAEVILADGVEALHGLAHTSELFDVVASNPPVHKGRPDDWRVLCGLINSADKVLNPRGQLWIVAQEHVPIGRLLALAHQGDGSRTWDISLNFSSEGRFLVWCAVRAGTQPTESINQRATKRCGAAAGLDQCSRTAHKRRRDETPTLRTAESELVSLVPGEEVAIQPTAVDIHEAG